MSKGKHWGSLTKQPGTEYQQVSTGESHEGKPSGKFIPGCKGPGYQTNSTGDSHPSVKAKKGFLGDTKGNKDFPPNHTSGVSQGQYKGK